MLNSYAADSANATAACGSSLIYHPAWRAAGLAFLAGIACLGVAGNLTILSLLCRFRSLHNGINACVGNIAVCDLLVCSLILPQVFAQRLASRVVLGGDVCLLSGCALFVCTGVANSSFALIGLNRYVFLLHPAAYHRCLEAAGHVVIRLTANWLLWMGLSGLVFSQRAFKYVPDSFVCFYGDDATSSRALAALVVLGMVSLPSAVAGFCYCRILLHVLASHRRVRDLVVAAVAAAAAPDRRAQLAEQRKLVKSLASIMLNYVLFNLLWLPYCCHVALVRLLDLGIEPAPPAGHNAIVWLALCSCTVKPLLQLSLNGEFRRRLLSPAPQPAQLAAARGVGGGKRIGTVQDVR